MTSKINKAPKVPCETQAANILHSLPDAVFTTDSQMRINYFNKAASELTGFKPNEAKGMYCRDVLKSTICDTNCPIKQALDSKEDIFDIETTIITADRKKLPILISATLLTSLTGDIIGYMHVFRDLSSTKKITSELEKSRNELAQKNQRLAKVIKDLKSTQQQLIQAQKMESIGTLAGGIAHDFNNLLSGILGYASLLKIKIDRDNPLYKFADTIEKSAVRASGLTRQLLTFSRRDISQLETLDIHPVIEDALHIIERTIPKTIQIEKHLSSDTSNIEADASQIEQVLINMLINARDAMAGGGKLTISTDNISLTEEDTVKNYIRISIADTGEGIPKANQNKIFDPFFSTKGKDKGTGLGLSTAYGIIKSHKGHIKLRSTQGEGSVFEIFLPVSSKTKYVRTHVTECEIGGGTETILLVDDEDIVRDLAEEVLTEKGYTVLTASNGIEALQRYKEHKQKIDLVILDLIMPKMDGIETYKHLKVLNPSLKILLSSGYNDNKQDMSTIRNEINGFLTKPYRANDLARITRKILDEE